jgi:RecA-family ATPase
MLTLQILAQALGGKISGGEVRAPGPGHSAQDRSLCVKLSDTARDGFIVYSHTNDPPIECRDYVKEKLAQYGVKTNGASHVKRERVSEEIIAKEVRAAINTQVKRHLAFTHSFSDADGTLLFQKLRYEPKDFRVRRPDGNGGWIWNLDKQTKRVPYRLQELLQYPDAQIHLSESEKDADRMAGLGLCATTVSNGDWTEDCIRPFSGRDVLIHEHNDAGGRAYAEKAARHLHGVANSIRIVRYIELAEKGDVCDWLDADNSRGADELYNSKCREAPLWTPTVETLAAKAEDNNASSLPPLPFISIADWDDEPLPNRDWAVLDRIPLRQTALFNGEGGAGKSMVALHQCCAHALGRDWLGTLPTQGPAIFIDAEDDEQELHIRTGCIAQHYGVTFRKLESNGLHLKSFVGMDAVLATVSRNGKIEPTNLYQQLLQAAGDIKPKLVAIASSANVFAGNENDRGQVQQFVQLLTRIAIVANGSVQLISHPSLTGIVSETGLSGSTQWHNAVRARAYMRGIKSDDDQPDNDLREIVFKKNQYGTLSDRMVLKYQRGMFLPLPELASLDQLAHAAKAQDVFLSLLKRFEQENRRVSANPGPGYAPKEFAQEDEAKKAHLSKDDLSNAMRALFKDEKIWNEPHGKNGRHHHIARKL